MSESDLRRIIASLDAALNTFAANEGQLEVSEIRARGMLSVVRRELTDHLARKAKRPREDTGAREKKPG